MSNSNKEIDKVVEQIQDNFFDYLLLEKVFNELLHKKLRKHEIARVLELWVPDSNIESGMLSLIDSIKSSNIRNFKVKLPTKYLSNNLIDNIIKKTNYIKKHIIEETNDENKIISFELSLDTVELSERDSEILSEETKTNQKHDFKAPEIEFRFKLKKIPKKTTDDFIDFDPKFEDALKERYHNLKFENNHSSEFNYISKIDNGAFSVLIDDSGIIKNCSHVNFKNIYQSSILDSFITNILNTTVQEAYEHGMVYTLDNIIKENFIDHKEGITLPKNAGSLFLLPKYLLHQIFEKFIAKTETDIEINFFYHTSSHKWKSIDYEEKLASVSKIVKATLQSSNYNQDDLVLHNISKNRNNEYTRCTFIFSENFPYSSKPELLRKLEFNLKRHIDSNLEVFAAAAKDTSPLRRLS